MQALAKGPLRMVFLVVLVGLTAWLGPGLTAVRAVDDMEDLCMGDMQWMIGWCMDTAPAGEVLATGDAAALALSACPRHDGGFTSIDVPDASATRAFGINARGDIVGSYTDKAVPPVTHGYLLRDGIFTTIDYPDAPGAKTTSTEAWGINSRGDIIGRYTRAGRVGVLGFLLSHGRFTDISIASPTAPDGKHVITLPTKIGASGHIVGCYHDFSPLVDMYGYVQRGNDLASPPFAGPEPGRAAAMHNGVAHGGRTIVGLFNPATRPTRGYRLSDDTFTYIDFPGSIATSAWDVNAGRTVVGQYRDAGGIHGFYCGDCEADDCDADDFVSIDVPGATDTRAFGINPDGHVVGMYVDANGTHGFLTKLNDDGDDGDDADDDDGE